MRTSILFLIVLGCGKSNTPGFGAGGLAGGLPISPPSNSDDGGGDADGGTTTDTGSTDGTASPTDTGDDVVERDADADADEGTTEDTGITIEGTGYTAGETAYNLNATDQAGGPFSLHSLYGQKVVLVVGNMDVATTTDTLSGIQGIMGDHSGVRFVAYIGNDTYGIPCDQSCAAEVASTYGFSSVVFGGAADTSTFSAWVAPSNTKTYLIHSSMEIYWDKSGTANEVVVSGRIDNLE